MAEVRCCNIKKTYKGNVLALDGVSLEIHDKEFMVITGPSGCGKSTLLRAIAGLEPFEEGEIYLDQTLINDIQPKDRDLAMVSQEYGLYPHMTVYQNLAFGLTVRKMDPDEIDLIVHRAARLLELEKLLARKPKTLSGGQLQRVALGRAIVRNPAAFLLDEPLSNLDSRFREGMRLQISRLHKQLDATFIYVTHDQIEAMTMADRVVVMDHGKILQVGTPMELYHQPGCHFVADFFGVPQMHFAEGLLTGTEESPAIRLNGYLIPLPPASEDMPEYNRNITHYLGKQVMIGIRPDGLCADADFIDRNPEGLLAASVTDVLMLGADMHVSLNVNNGTLVARASSDLPISVGMTIKASVDCNHIHLFDPLNGEAIWNPCL